MMFGEFLVKNEVITEKQLVEALVLQFEKSPSLFKILAHQANEKEFLSAVKLMKQQNKDILNLQKEYEVFNQEVFQKAIEQQKNESTPLGQYLINLNFIDLNRLQDYLMKYHESGASISSESEPAQDAPVGDEKSSSKHSEFADFLEQAPLDDFLEKIDEKNIEEFYTLLEHLDPESPMNDEAADFIYKHLLQIQKNAENMQSIAILKILKKMTQALEEHLENPKDFIKLRDFIKEGMILVLSFGKVVRLKKTETAVSQIPRLVTRLNKFI